MAEPLRKESPVQQKGVYEDEYPPVSDYGSTQATTTDAVDAEGSLPGNLSGLAFLFHTPGGM